MDPKDLTLYKQGGGYKSLGWNINNSILNSNESYVVPAALLCVNNNFECKNYNQVQKGVVKEDLFDKLYNFLDSSKSKKNKTKKLRKKRKNKTRKY